MNTEYEQYINNKYGSIIENVCMSGMIETPDNQLILPINFFDIEWYSLEVSEYLIENSKDLIIITKQALELIDLPNGISIDKIKIQFEDLPMLDFEMIEAEYIITFF